MTIPNLPTDNLYKFLALAGVASVLAGYWLTSESQFERAELISRERQASEDRMLTEMGQLVDRVLKEHDNEEQRTNSMQNMQPMVDLRQGLELGKLTKRIREIETETKNQIHMLGFLKVIGYCSAPLGFLLWWFRVQRYQDAIIVAEYQKTRTPNSTLRRP